MLLQNFILIGTNEGHSVDLSALNCLSDLQHGIASLYSIAEPAAISFHSPTSKIDALEAIRSQKEPVGIKVNGKQVRKPQDAPGLPFVGNHFEIYPDHMGNHERLFARYGSVIKTVNMGTVTYLTNDPQASEVILGENEFFTKKTSDPSHLLYYMRDSTSLFFCDTNAPTFKISHKFIPPSMSPKAVSRYLPAMQHAISKCFGVLDELDEKEQAFNTYRYMFKLAGQIIYKIVLGLELEHFASIDSPPHEIIHLLGEYMKLAKETQLSPPWYKYLPFGAVRRLEEVRAKAWALVGKAVEDCASGGPENLSLHEAALNATCVADYLKRATDEKGNKIPREYLLSNIVVLIGAGFITSASLLSWLLYVLVTYPSCQQKLLQELVDAGASPDKAWTYDEITSLPFLARLVKETLRLHNPSFQTARNAKKDVILPGAYVIPAGSIVIPTFPSIHKNKDYWDNPENFNPDRWTGDQEGGRDRHRMAFTPFAAGPRGCIGYNVAQLEAKLALANLVYRYCFVEANTEAVVYDPEFLVIRPVNHYVRAIRRVSWPDPSQRD